MTVIYVADVSGLIFFQSRAITVDDDQLNGPGSVKVTLIKHVFDSKEFQLGNVPPYLSIP